MIEADAGFAAIEQVHRLMSAHDPASDVSRINCGAHREGVAVSAPTADVLRCAMRWAEVSDAAFDIVSAGRRSLARGALPRHPGQPLPDPFADWKAVRLNGNSVRLDRPACLDLGGIAKGYAVDRAIDAMRDAGAMRGLVNAGGDLRVFGDHAWLVTVPDPSSRQPLVSTRIMNTALATSAGLPDESGHLDFSHLHRSMHNWMSVTVRAPNACDADALAKIVWVMGSRAEILVRDHEAEAFVIESDQRIQPLWPAKAIA